MYGLECLCVVVIVGAGSSVYAYVCAYECSRVRCVCVGALMYDCALRVRVCTVVNCRVFLLHVSVCTYA